MNYIIALGVLSAWIVCLYGMYLLFSIHPILACILLLVVLL